MGEYTQNLTVAIYGPYITIYGPYMAMYGLYMVIYDHIWSIYGHIWSHMGHIWPYMAHIWPYVAHIWPYMASQARKTDHAKTNFSFKTNPRIEVVLFLDLLNLMNHLQKNCAQT